MAYVTNLQAEAGTLETLSNRWNLAPAAVLETLPHAGVTFSAILLPAAQEFGTLPLGQDFVPTPSPSRVWPHQSPSLEPAKEARKAAAAPELNDFPRATAWQLHPQGSDSQAHHREPQGSRRDSAPCGGRVRDLSWLLVPQFLAIQRMEIGSLQP